MSRVELLVAFYANVILTNLWASNKAYELAILFGVFSSFILYVYYKNVAEVEVK